MTAASVAAEQTKKLMKFSLSLFRRGFNPSKCKTAAKMAVARIKLLRNKRQVIVKQMRRDIAMLLQSGQDATARIRVEHVIREQNILAANELIELFCELVVSRLTIISKQRSCPEDLKEGISSLIFASPRCSEIPELGALTDIFRKKYGKDFVDAAIELRPSCGVNRMLVDKLSVRNPTGELKLKIMKEIAKEFQIEWDMSESEQELLKPPEAPIEGPRAFVSASSMPVRRDPDELLDPRAPPIRSSSNVEGVGKRYEDTASAAEAAAELAKQAIAAAQAAASLAGKEGKDSKQFSQQPVSDRNSNNVFPVNSYYTNTPPTAAATRSESKSVKSSYYYVGDEEKRSVQRRQSYPHSGNEFDETDPEGETYDDEADGRDNRSHKETRNVSRRHSYNAPSVNSDIKFDESDEEEGMEEAPPLRMSRSSWTLPPNRPPPRAPPSEPTQHVHPKLPDYDTLAARFEDLKFRRMSRP